MNGISPLPQVEKLKSRKVKGIWAVTPPGSNGALNSPLPGVVAGLSITLPGRVTLTDKP